MCILTINEFSRAQYLSSMEKAIDLSVFDGIDGMRTRGSVSGPIKPNDFDRDKYELARVGKEQVLKVSIIHRMISHYSY